MPENSMPAKNEQIEELMSLSDSECFEISNKGAEEEDDVPPELDHVTRTFVRPTYKNQKTRRLVKQKTEILEGCQT